MKTFLKTLTSPWKQKRSARKFAAPSRRGFALVLVLGVTVLVVILITGFLASTMTEHSASAGVKASSQARQLGDIAVNLVQGQINQASTQGSNVAWVSQPGMVRTFDTSGSLVRAYKLYSASNMISNKVEFSAGLPKDDIVTNWKDSPSIWVDLNAPITANGIKNFPIASPAALDTMDNVLGLGPNVSGGPKGFSIINPATRAAAQAPGVTSATDYQILPMPVRWLYVLQDGTLVAADTGTAPGSASIVGATASNPVVGRIAFWTDDESCKVNINTAGEGVFWDTPHGYSPMEVFQFALRQPWGGEYNRYPGHPAMVSLSSIFPVQNYSTSTLPLSASNCATLEQFLNLTPAYTYNGGSQGGNVLIPNIAQTATKAGSFGASLVSMARKSERLYSSVDEFMFVAKDRTNNSILTKDLLESRRFFLTAHSRAPETNLFNLPRVAVWPVQKLADPDWLKKTNPFDRLIAFCASTSQTSGSALPFFFQRTQASNSNDLSTITRNQQLYAYLQELTSRNIPGFGGNFANKYNTPGERDQILTQIFDYIRTTNLYDSSLDFAADGVTPVSPKGLYTFSKTFDTATNSGTNIEGTAGGGQAAPSIGPSNTMGQGRYFTLNQLMMVFIACAKQDSPITVDGSGNETGRDRSNDIKEEDPATTVPPFTMDNSNWANWWRPWSNPMLREPYPSGPLTQLTQGQRRVQLMIVPQLFCTMAGMLNLNPDTTIEIKGLDQFKLNGNSLKLPSGIGAQPCWVHISGSSQALGGGLWDSVYNYRAQFVVASTGDGKWTDGDVVPVPPTIKNYSMISVPVTVPSSGMSFTGGKIIVNIYDGQGVSGTLLQTINMEVPNGNFPTPDLARPTGAATAEDPRYWSAFNFSKSTVLNSPLALQGVQYFDWNGGPTTAKYLPETWGRARQRSTGTTNNFPDQPILTSYDVVRAMVPTPAAYDYRLVSPVTNNSSDLYIKHPGWDTAVLNASLFSNGTRALLTKSGVTPAGMVLDNIEKSATFTAVNVDSTGDFDVGPGGYLKGSLSNKPDEGDMYRETNANWAGFTPDSATAPYFQGNRQEAAYAVYFSPNRIIPSPVMLGSISTGVKEKVPWRTLLFRPLAQRESAHKGATSPPDYLLLDLFWMPVVEPYAISDQLSTAGKINMNYQIMPFTYIDRSAPLRAVLKPERIVQLDLNYLYATKLSSGGPGSIPMNADARKLVSADETLHQFEQRFDQSDKNKNVFISPSEICAQYLIPEGTTYSTASAAAVSWDAYRQTGDNLRERPYATIYPKLTTKSNSYTVHFRAQSLKKVPGGDQTVWTEGRDKVIGEYRGSTTVERFIDPSANIPDYAANPGSISTMPTLDNFYRWRVVNNRQFAP